MRGSLALWYERPEGRPACVKLPIELHFNLWRDLTVSGTNVFDMGILFKPPQHQSPAPPKSCQRGNSRCDTRNGRDQRCREHLAGTPTIFPVHPRRNRHRPVYRPQSFNGAREDPECGFQRCRDHYEI
jgi:hypothetical protein